MIKQFKLQKAHDEPTDVITRTLLAPKHKLTVKLEKRNEWDMLLIYAPCDCYWLHVTSLQIAPKWVHAFL